MIQPLLLAQRALATAIPSMSSATDVVPLWVQGCGQLAPLASIVVFLAPIPTMRQISKDRSVGSMPLLPYSSMVSSAFVWITYGILKQERKIWLTNAIGLLLGLYYVLEFIKYAPKRSPTLPGSVMGHLQACVALILATVGIATLVPKSAAIVGNLGVVLCVAMFGSPLASLKTVLLTKSAESIPLPFTLASVINCLLWSVVGLLDMKDANIYFPNLLGLSFGLIQVGLKMMYGSGSSKGLELPL